jgi:hypothetical protein
MMAYGIGYRRLKGTVRTTWPQPRSSLTVAKDSVEKNFERLLAAEIIECHEYDTYMRTPTEEIIPGTQ